MSEDVVADGVAVGVVDPLELVDVDQRHRQRALVPVRALDLDAQDAQAGGSIEEARELVGRGHRLDVRDAGDQPAQGVVEHRVGDVNRIQRAAHRPTARAGLRGARSGACAAGR